MGPWTIIYSFDVSSDGRRVLATVPSVGGRVLCGISTIRLIRNARPLQDRSIQLAMFGANGISRDHRHEADGAGLVIEQWSAPAVFTADIAGRHHAITSARGHYAPALFDSSMQVWPLMVLRCAPSWGTRDPADAYEQRR